MRDPQAMNHVPATFCSRSLRHVPDARACPAHRNRVLRRHRHRRKLPRHRCNRGATWHAPTLDSPTLDYDVRHAKGVAKSGVHCDYCHKIADAPTDKLGTRFGRDGLMLLRPADGDSLTIGPLDDAVRPGESFANL